MPSTQVASTPVESAKRTENIAKFLNRDHPLRHLFPRHFFLDGARRERDGHPTIALTFDDGPDAKYTPQVLEILARYKIHATFFLQGIFVKAHPSIVRDIVRRGHEIALHSYDHVDLKHVSDPRVAYDTQVARASYEFERAGVPVPSLYRPAFGAITAPQVAQFAEHGLKVINWSIDTEDWRRSPRPTSEQIEERVVGNAYGGAVALMHSGGGDRSQTVAALPRMIERLKEKGFVFERVSDILEN